MAFLSLGKVRSSTLGSITGHVMPVAIDFGTSSLKLLQLASSGPGQPPALVAAAAVETPDALLFDPAKRFAFQCQALPRLVKAGKFKGKRAVCAIPAGNMFCKHMQFPRAENVSLEDLVQSAVPAALEVSPDALVLRHFAVENAIPPGTPSSLGGEAASTGGGIKQEVICLAASREMINKMMAAIREAKLAPVGIHTECVATLHAFEHITRRASDEFLSTLYLDLAAGTTKVWIAHGPQSLVFAKTIQMGGCEFDQAVARALDLKLSDARAKRLSASILMPAAAGVANQLRSAAHFAASENATVARDGRKSTLTSLSDPSQMIAEERRHGQTAPGLTASVTTQPQIEVAPPEFNLQDQIEFLTDEIAMCIRYYEGLFPGRRLDRAVFFGGEARHRGLCQHVAKRLRVGAQVADPLARMARSGNEPCLGVDFTTPQPGWTIAFGLSLAPTDL